MSKCKPRRVSHEDDLIRINKAKILSCEEFYEIWINRSGRQASNISSQGVIR